MNNLVDSKGFCSCGRAEDGPASPRDEPKEPPRLPEAAPMLDEPERGKGCLEPAAELAESLDGPGCDMVGWLCLVQATDIRIATMHRSDQVSLGRRRLMF